MSRCTGHCCDVFTLDLEALTDPERNINDGDYIRDMVYDEWQDDEGRWWVSCRHFNGKDCTAYESRPDMCSTYPYGKECKRPGCTYEAL